MTWSEIRAVHASGQVSVQSHTLQSQFLPEWPAAVPLSGVDPRIESAWRRRPLDIATDLRIAREQIEAHCPGAAVRHLCYPDYRTTPEGIEALAAAGYVAGWGGLLPGRPLVRPGISCGELPRLSWVFLRRMPGEGRVTFAGVVVRQLGNAWRACRRQWAGHP
jgi:hypothetical protein